MLSRVDRKGVIAVALFAVFCSALGAWAWAGSISASRTEDRDDLDLFLDASSAGWAEVTSQFFAVPEVAAQTIGALSGQMETPEARLALLAETIRPQPNIDSAYIGYPDGSFVFIGRSDEVAPGGFRTRVFSIEDGVRSVELGWTDANLVLLESEPDPTNPFDPRTRPWYEPLAAGEDRFWTPPYVFNSSQQPGITHSMAVTDSSGELVAAVGIDIRLSAVTEFLQELSPGQNGVALVVNNTGQIVAESSMILGDLVVEESGDAVALLESPELRSMVEQLERDEDATTVIERSASGLRTTVLREAGVDGRWYVAVRALDDDFIDERSASNAFEIFAVALTIAAFAGALGWAILRYLGGLKEEAETDELTGIYNRRAVKRLLSTLLHRADRPVHVAIIDLDNFKAINDEHGHQVGDELLSTVAHRLRQFASLSDATAGRLGGDEFVVFAEGQPPDWAWLNTRLADPVTVGDLELIVTASIGAATSGHESTDEINALLGEADHKLFAAKRQGGDSFQASTETAEPNS